MQVFVCSGWTGNLRKWKTLAPTPLCEFVHSRAEAERDPQEADESLQTWHPGSSRAHEVCAHLWVWAGILGSSSSSQSHLGKDAEVRAELSAHVLHQPCGTLGACVQLLGWRKRRRMEPCCPSPASRTASLQSCSAVATALSGLCLPALTIQNNKYLCSLQANSYKWFVCSIEAALYVNFEKPLLPSCLMGSWKCPQTPLWKHKAGSWAARCTALWFSSFLYI